MVKVKDYIVNTVKKNYVKTNDDIKYDYKIDCGDGINIMQVSEDLVSEIRNADLEWIREYPKTPMLKPAVINYWSKIEKISDDALFFTGGSMRAIKVSCRLFLEKGDKVLGFLPTFSTGESEVKLWGAEYDGIYTKKENGFTPDINDLIKKYNSSYKMIYIDNPNNPTGNIIDIKDIEKVVALAQKDGTGVLIDEAYGDFMPMENSAISLVNKYPNIIVLRSFSKGFGIAGMRIGYIVCGDELKVPFFKATEPYGVCVLSRRLAAKCLSEENDFLKNSLEETKKVKEKILKEVFENLLISNAGEYLPIMVISHKNKDINLAIEFAKLGIKVVSGEDFTALDKSSVRFRIPKKEEINEVITAMKKIDLL